MEESVSWGQNSSLSVSSCCTLLEKHQQISGNSFKHSKNLHTMQEDNKGNLSEYLNYTVCLCSFFRNHLEIKSKREKKNLFFFIWKVFAVLFLMCNWFFRQEKMWFLSENMNKQLWFYPELYNAVIYRNS